MKTVILIDNIGDDVLTGEWGLSFYIEYRDRKILLDAGGISGAFAGNAEKLGIPLEEVDAAVLSHAHYDHADGMSTFFRLNDHAKLYLRESCGENCYKKPDGKIKYIGIRQGFLEAYAGRLVRVSGTYQLGDGIWLLPHTAPAAWLEEAGNQESMCLKVGEDWITDCFEHEQSLVFELPEGLVIFSSCSHAGADLIISEVRQAFPDREILAILGGFHLYNKTPEYVRNLAERIRSLGKIGIYTGHCTGEEGYEILREKLGDSVHQLRSGMEIRF